MTNSDSINAEPNARRLTALEEAVMHFERTTQDLHEVVLAQQQQITALERRVSRLIADLETLADKTQEVRRLEDDKPPHY